jgi:tetratricopeptide (TPR) repeat protein
MSRLSALLFALAISMLAVPALAQPSKEAAQHFDHGLALFKQKKFLEAADEFKEAYRIFPHGDALFNAGMAWEGAGMRAVAATAYARALEEGVRPKTEAKARAHLATLEKQLGKVVLEMPPGSTIHVDVLTLEGDRVVAYAEPGTRTFVVTLKDGQRVTRSVDVAVGQTQTETIELPKPPAPPPRPPPPAPHEEPKPDTTWRTAGYVSLGVAGVATGAAIFFGLKAVSANNSFNDSSQTDRDAHDRALSNMHIANVCWGVAAVSAVGGGVLLLYVAPQAEASGKEKSGSVTLFGRF